MADNSYLNTVQMLFHSLLAFYIYIERSDKSLEVLPVYFSFFLFLATWMFLLSSSFWVLVFLLTFLCVGTLTIARCVKSSVISLGMRSALLSLILSHPNNFYFFLLMEYAVSQRIASFFINLSSAVLPFESMAVLSSSPASLSSNWFILDKKPLR